MRGETAAAARSGSKLKLSAPTSANTGVAPTRETAVAVEMNEMAGTIAAVGAGVETWRTGDRVAVFHHVPCRRCYYCERGDYAQCDLYKQTGTTAGFDPAGGGFAECIRVMDWVVASGMVRVPDEVSFEEATFVEPVATVLKAIERAGVTAGDTVLVVGLGQIGLLFTQIIGLRGASIVGSDPLPDRRERALAYGAAAVVDPADARAAAESRARTAGRGADVAVVAVADTRVVAEAVEAVRPGGRVLLFAQTRLGDALSVDAGQVCMLEKSLLGSYSSDISLQEEAADLVMARRIDVGGLITHRFPLDEITDALRTASRPQEGALKIMVTL